MQMSKRQDRTINQPRRNLKFEQRTQDPYQTQDKWPEPTSCPDCHAVFHKGRWQWSQVPENANQHRCPACSRIQDNVPAGILTLSGDFFMANKEEIMNLVHNTEKNEKSEHPLERIMNVEEQTDKTCTIIKYTGIHLTKSTGEALHHAYQGEFEFKYTDRDGVLQASWKR
jgi:hypothetical protein